MINALSRTWGAASLYSRMFGRAVRGSWLRTLLIFILDVVSAVANSSVMIVLTLTLAVVATGDGLERIREILTTYDPGIGFADWPPEGFVYLSGLVSIGLFTMAAALRYFAAIIARAIARRFHRNLVHNALNLNYSASPLVQSKLLAVPGAVSIAAIQNSIHASKGVETLLRLPQIVAFVIVLAAIVFFLRPVAASLLAVVVLAGAPVIYLISRAINQSAGDFYSTRSRGFGQQIASRLNSLNGMSGSFPEQSPRLDAEQFKAVEAEYLDSFDAVQMASERVAFFTGIIRGLGFGAGLMFVIYSVSINQEPLSEIGAFAVLMYLMVAYLSSIFSSMSSLVIYLPQIAAYDRVEQELLRAQANNALSDDASANGPWVLTSATNDAAPLEIAPGQIVSLAGIQFVERFDLGDLITALNSQFDAGHIGQDAVLVKSMYYDFPDLTLKELDAAYRNASGETLSELGMRLGISEYFGNWYRDALPNEWDSPLSGKNWRLATGQVQGMLMLAIARANPARHYFLDRTIITRFHRDARIEARAVFGKDAVLWLYSANDEFEAVGDETVKLSLINGKIDVWPYKEKLDFDQPASGPDSTLTTLV